MPYGDRHPAALLADDAAWADEPRRLAAELGHDVVNDTTGVERWTCTRCARAALRYGCNIYGSAAEVACTGKE